MWALSYSRHFKTNSLDIYRHYVSEMDVPTWFSVLFAAAGLLIVACFAFQYGVFGKCCSFRNHGTRHSVGYGIGVGDGDAKPEGVDSSQVTAVRAESEEEGARGSSETESGRSGGLSEDERAEEDEDWGGTV